MRAKVLIIILFAALVVKVKHMVNTASSSVKLANIQIAQSKDNLDILKAEHAYLERPERILEEAKKLEMHAAKPHQIVFFSEYVKHFEKLESNAKGSEGASEQIEFVGPR